MTSPLADLYGTAPPREGGPTSPLQDLYGTSAPTAAPASPLQDLYATPDVGEPGPAQIAAGEEQNIQQNMEQLEALLKTPGIQPAQRQRIEGIIARYKEPAIKGFAVGNRVTERRSVAENVARGFGAGAINYGILGAADLIAATGQMMVPKSWESSLKLPQFRERIADSQQLVKELFDPQGYAGGTGTVVGAFATGFAPTKGVQAGGSVATAIFKPYEVLNSVGFKALSRVSPAAAAIVTKGTRPGAPFLARLAAQWVGSTTVDAVQVADVLTHPGMTTDDKVRAIALAALASGGAATAASLRAVKPTAAEIAELKKEARRKGVVAPEAPAPGAKPERAVEAEKMAAEAMKAEAKSQLSRRINRAAQVEWETANPTLTWAKDLTKEQRSDILGKYRERYAQTHISPPAPEPAPTPGAPKPATAEAPPVTAPEPTPAPPPLAAGVEAAVGVRPAEAPPVVEAGVAPSTGVKVKLTPGYADRYTVTKIDEHGGLAAHREAQTLAEVHELAPGWEPPKVEGEVARLQTELVVTREQRDIAEREAQTDAMTGLANQNAWQRALPAANADPNIKVMLWDLQSVKYMNDKVSRAEADQYIIDGARAIETAVRSHDAGARIFRYGGDEFGAFVPAGADHEAIAATAKQIMGSSAIEGFPLGLRHSSGATATHAEAAMASVKAGETAPKYRPLKLEPTTEQAVPGVELKKPLAKHSVDELDKLYDKIDNLHDTGKINDIAYREGILAIADAKRGLKASGVAVESLAPSKKEKVASDLEKMVRESETSVLISELIDNMGYAAEGAKRKSQYFPGMMARFQELARRGLSDEQILDRFVSNRREQGFDDAQILAALERTKRFMKQANLKLVRGETAPDVRERPNPAAVTGAAVVRGGALPETKLPTELRQATDPNVFRRRFAARIDKMGVPELEAHREDLSSRVTALDKRTAKDSGYLERLAKVNEEIAGRVRAAEGPGVTLRTDPRVVGFAAGFGAGFFQPVDDEQERWANALYWGLAGAAGTHFGLRVMQRAKDDAVPEWQKEIREHVKSVEDAPLERRKGIYSFLLTRYGNIARRDIAVTEVVRLSGGANLPAGRNPGKMMEMFGLWNGMADRWMFGDRVGTYDRDGNWVQFDAKTIQQIAGMVDGDIRTVGDLAAAKHELELRSLPEPKTTGLKLETSRKMYANTAEKYHQASEELTKFFRAMKEYSVMSGLLSKESSDRMDAQQFYVAVRRLFPNEPGTQPQTISTKGAKQKTGIGIENLFKGLKGGKRPYQNPAEAAISLLPRYMRAGEMNRLTTEFFDHLSAVSKKDRALVGRPLTRAETPKIEGEDAKIQELRDYLAKEGTHISEQEAHAMVSHLSDESLNITNDVVRFYRNGKMEAWRVSEPIARAFRSLQPHELEAFMAGAGIFTKPTNLARVGITANPVFVGYQFIRDIWQYHMNGTYAVRPDTGPVIKILQAPLSLVESGAGNMRGWLAQMFWTKEFLKYAAVGAGGESVASQGLQVIRGQTRKLEKVKEKPARNQFEQIAQEVKAMNFREAYASILGPIADAGRIGAYLKERGRGADVIEAVYRAKKAGANFSNRGDAVQIQALNRMTLFLNPAIQGMDASRHAFMKDPVGYMARGILGIALPSAMLWAAYKDDEEIVRLRGTPSGKRFWFFRAFGEIRKIPKPIFEGQIFGSTVESYLDRRNKDDPEAVRNWTEAMYNDAALTFLPFVGVAPLSLMTGKALGLYTDIVPKGTERLDVEHRAKPETSTLARIVSRAAAPAARSINAEWANNALSPAGVDFLIQNFLGGLGTEAAKTLSIAIDLQAGGDLPPNEELPFIRAVYGRYPQMNTTPIIEFYRGAERAEQAANTLAHLARTKPEAMADYIDARMSEIRLAEMYRKDRQVLADYRRAIEDFRQAPREIMDDATKRDMIKIYAEMMIEQAAMTNELARSINEME